METSHFTIKNGMGNNLKWMILGISPALPAKSWLQSTITISPDAFPWSILP
jgi:hypothetical protein